MTWHASSTWSFSSRFFFRALQSKAILEEFLSCKQVFKF